MGDARSSFSAAAKPLAGAANRFAAAVSSMAGAALRRAAAPREFADDEFAIIGSRDIKRDAPNEKGALPIEFTAYQLDFSRNATAGLKAPTPAIVAARKRSCATNPTGIPASEVFACRVCGRQTHVLPPSL